MSDSDVYKNNTNRNCILLIIRFSAVKQYVITFKAVNW